MSLFEGSRLSVEVKTMSNVVNKLEQETFERILQLVQGFLEGKKVSPNVMEKAFGGSTLDAERRQLIAHVIAGLLVTFKAALRLPESRLKKEALKEDLEELKLSSEIVDRLCDVILSESYRKMNQCQVVQCPRLMTLKRFRWRIDVSISTSSLSRIFEPTIMVKMVTNDGSVWNFEMPLKRFHQLRCNVAILLKEMEELENRNAIKMLD